jgi:hypothetical protein
MRAALSACVWALGLTSSIASAASTSVDSSFQLSAGFEDLANYFPGYLANGYIATLTTPQGTAPAPAYMVGLMDRAAGDMSRPAIVPDWGEMDFSAGATDSEAGWLNRAPLDAGRFQDYRQTLDLRNALLRTTYRYIDRQRSTGVEVSTLVDEAAPHLAATQLRLTPDFDGNVRLRFGFTLWAEHAPRFSLARLSGPEVEEAVAANGLVLRALPPATPDRAALWYPGHVQVQRAEGDAGTLSLWLDGRAEQGQSLGMAAAVALPDGVHPQSVTVTHDQYQLSLDVTLPVVRGQTYVFTKYAAMSRSGWGGNGEGDLDLARQARQQGFDRLFAEHRAAWADLWTSDIEIEGDARAQQLVHSELYHLLASSTASSAFGIGACGLTTGYAGHIFWDSDTWIFPALLLLQPQRAESLVNFRARTLEPARQRAHLRGFEGAMYPWESDPENGTEQTPHSAYILGETEIHVNADVAIAQWQYYLATKDSNWLRRQGWPVIRDVARFWASRARYDPERHRYGIEHVNSVAESHTDIPNDTFTNVSAARALSIATLAAPLVGERADPLWRRIATELYVPLSADGKRHLPFDPSVSGEAPDFGGGTLSLLFLPSLDLPMADALLREDYGIAAPPGSLALVADVSMGIAPRTIAADTVGDAADAEAALAANFSGGTLKPPFNVRTESADNNVGYFMTGSGGYVQSLIFGLAGLRIREQGLVQAYAPILPRAWQSMTLRNLQFRGQRIDIRIQRDARGAVQVTRTVH